MPLPMKTLKEAAADLGIPEAELRVMVQTNKVKAVMRKGTLCIAPDALARISRLRRTVLDPTNRAATPKPATPAATGPAAKAPAKTAAPPRPSTGSPATRPPRPGLKLPEPPKDA